MRGSLAPAGLDRQVYTGQYIEGLGVDVGLKEPVEEHQAVRAGRVQPQRDLAGRTELRAELDRHRHTDVARAAIDGTLDPAAWANPAAKRRIT